ncbi:LysR family transcriptional regulator [Kitasatospora sp. NPDC052896]|uniref:LysR family transcriptional regulator n=1 Tax=Kitasatospora sp. NPDC052896 TaxID=3364061 RepID=UPI0037CAFEB6
MDLDLAQVRAFAATAEHRHFGRAAAGLAITQQALSKRVARLEQRLGERLFERGAGPVRLTAAGERFLGPARALLAAGEDALAAVGARARPLRLDVWGHLFGPLRTVRQGMGGMAESAVEVGSGRDLPSAAGAMLRGEADAGFGRHHALSDGRDEALAHRLVRLEPVDAILGAEHPLAGADQLRPADLRGSRLLCPANVERLDFLRRFAERFEVAVESGEANLGVEHLLARLRATPDGFSLLPAEVPLPDGAAGAGLRAVPLVEPVPLYAWSLVWPRRQAHPGIAALLRGFAEAGRRHRWLEYRPDRDWLPEADQLRSH